MGGSKFKSDGQNVQGIFGPPRHLPNIHGVTRGNHNIEQWDGQTHGLNRIRIGCHQWCSKWGLHQGEHKGKVVGLLHREGDQKGAAMATPSQGVYGDAMLRNQQGADPFCSNSIIGAHMGVVDLLETWDTQPPWKPPIGGIQIAIGWEVHAAPLGASGWDGALGAHPKEQQGATYVQDFNQMLIVVPLKDEYAKKLIFLHKLKP
jgi:hypothetical protein